MTAGGGTEERAFTGVRYGFEISERTHARIYGKALLRDNQVTDTGTAANDHWNQGRVGMRMDHTTRNGDLLTLQGDYYNGKYHETVNLPTLTAPVTQLIPTVGHTEGGNVLARWTRTFSATSGMSLQAYYDRLQLGTIRGGIILDTWDIDYQQHASWGDRHRFIWGLGYRMIHGRGIAGENVLGLSVMPPGRWFDVWSGFFQDDIALLPNKVYLNLGTKLEHNDYTGLVVQPSAKLSWTPTSHQTIWGGVSRAVRTPMQHEDDVLTYQPAFVNQNPVAVVGNRNFRNENLIAYELGYRHQVTTDLSFDLATYYHDYSSLRTVEPGSPFAVSGPLSPHMVHPLYFSNLMKGETYGVEVAVDWRPKTWWRIQPSYTFMAMNLDADKSKNPAATRAEGESPSHQASVRSLMTLPYQTELDLWGRYVDNLPALNIPSYVTLDVRLGWRPMPRLEVSLVGQNLLDSHRPEFRENLVAYLTSEIQRGFYGRVTWRW